MWYTLLREGMCPFIGGQNEFVDGLSCSCSAYGKVAVSPITYYLGYEVYVTPVSVPFQHYCKSPPGFDYYRNPWWGCSWNIPFWSSSSKRVETLVRGFTVDSSGPSLVSSLVLSYPNTIPRYSSAYVEDHRVVFANDKTMRPFDWIPTIHVYDGWEDPSHFD